VESNSGWKCGCNADTQLAEVFVDGGRKLSFEALKSSLLYEVYMACPRPTSHHGLRFMAGYMTEI
jgi:hypothetical protein